MPQYGSGMARKAQHHTARTRLFLVDDEPAVRRGLQVLLDHEPDFEVCGAAESIGDALKQILLCEPDIAVVDLRLRRGNGLTLIRRLRQSCPRVKVLVFSMHDELSTAEAAFRAGADGFVAKYEGSEKLFEAIACLMAGKSYVTPSLAARIRPDH